MLNLYISAGWQEEPDLNRVDEGLHRRERELQVKLETLGETTIGSDASAESLDVTRTDNIDNDDVDDASRQ